MTAHEDSGCVWEGVVVEVGKETFWTQVVDLVTGDEAMAEFEFGVSGREWALVRGTLFYWVVCDGKSALLPLQRVRDEEGVAEGIGTHPYVEGSIPGRRDYCWKVIGTRRVMGSGKRARVACGLPASDPVHAEITAAAAAAHEYVPGGRWANSCAVCEEWMMAPVHRAGGEAA